MGFAVWGLSFQFSVLRLRFVVQVFILLISSLDAQHAEILSRLEASAGTRRGKLTFVSMDVTSEDNKGVLDYFGVKAEDAPTIYLVVLKEQMLK